MFVYERICFTVVNGGVNSIHWIDPYYCGYSARCKLNSDKRKIRTIWKNNCFVLIELKSDRVFQFIISRSLHSFIRSFVRSASGVSFCIDWYKLKTLRVWVRLIYVILLCRMCVCRMQIDQNKINNNKVRILFIVISLCRCKWCEFLFNRNKQL